MSALLSMTGVRKVYDTGLVKVEALRGIDLEVETGDYVAIMGPSGSGKSTLMHIIGCLDVPTSGRYVLDGEEVADLTQNQLSEVRNRRLGFVFQSFNLLPSLTAQRNVELPMVYAGVEPGERRHRARAALERVGLGNRRDHRPGELSGGRQQRVSVARALVTDPALILADEPTGALDSVSTRDILDLFAELNASGRTIVVITHEAEVADLTQNQLSEVRNRRLGFVFQSFNLLPSLTAQRNVELPMVYAGVEPGERRERARAALERVGLGNRRDHRPGELSGGQQQRVSVARALVTDPALILADEPTGALDSVSTRDILDLFAELNASGRTIVVITHEAEVAERARRVVHIYDGQLVTEPSHALGGVA